MLTILHGDNIVASRSELVRLKETAKDKEIRDINGKNIDQSDLRQAVESLSLFGNTILIVIENTFSSIGRKEKQIKLLSEIINTASNTVDIILWEPKELGKTVLGEFKKANIQIYKTPAIIFEFLDALVPQRTKQILTVFEKTAEAVPAELILYMIQMRIRHLIQIKDQITPEKMSPWQAMRLTNQAKSFTMDKLLSMRTKLIDLEYSLKTGATPYNLTQLIITFILDI
jgi:DNA polymerase III delta subunit